MFVSDVKKKSLLFCLAYASLVLFNSKKKKIGKYPENELLFEILI